MKGFAELRSSQLHTLAHHVYAHKAGALRISTSVNTDRHEPPQKPFAHEREASAKFNPDANTASSALDRRSHATIVIR